MLTVERQRGILQYLDTNRSADISSLAVVLGVSASTIRRDLNELAASGAVRRVRGGAVNGNAESTERVASERMFTFAEQKERIAAAAARLVPPSSTIFISGGTTTERLIPLLAQVDSLVVITNAVNIAHRLGSLVNIETIVLGGSLRHLELTLLGGVTERAVRQHHVDVAFYGCFGIDPESGLSAASMLEAATDREVVGATRRLVVLADHSKFSQRGPALIAGVDKITTLVTDGDAPADALARLEQRGVEVIRA